MYRRAVSASLDDARTSAAAQALIERLCRSPSVSAEQDGLEETAGLVASLLAETGFTTRLLRVPGAAPAVWGELPGRSPYTLLLYNHYDVQPADPLDLWTWPPFEPTVRDGRLFARGASDNKGEIGVRLAVVRELLAADGELPCAIRWVIEGEEEIGSRNFAAIAAAHADLLRADAAFWEGAEPDRDGRPEIAIGVKGVLAFRLEVETMTVDAHSGSAGVLPGAPWRLLEAIAAIRGADGRVLLPGFYEAVAEPSDEQIRALREYGETIERDLAETHGVTRFNGGLTGDALLRELSLAPSMNISGLTGGYAGPGLKTVTPARASAGFDFRLVPDQDPADVERSLRETLSAAGLDGVQVTVLVSARPEATPIDHPLVRRVAAIAARAAGREPLIMPVVPGSLPLVTALREHAGVPGLSPPTNPVYPGTRAHAPDEHIRLEDIPKAVRMTRSLLRSVADGSEGY